MSKGQITALVGAGMAVVGLIVGFMPVSSGGADCGSALNRESNLYVGLTQGTSAANGCESLTSILAIPTWVLLILGGLLLVGGLMVHSDKKGIEEAKAKESESQAG